MSKSATGPVIHTIGLDIAKTSFSVHGFDREWNTVIARDLKRGQVLAWFSHHAPCRVGLEACASAHHWAREIARLGHDVKLIPAQRVKAFLPRMKNDAADAKAIARAVGDPEMRFAEVKSLEQQALLMLFKARDLLVAQRTAIINALRGHFGEMGIVVPKGPKEVSALVSQLMTEEQSNTLPPMTRAALRPLVAMLYGLSDEIKTLGQAILAHHKASETSQRLATIPGIGPLTATLIAATVNDARRFEGGREFAAWIGLVPRQHSTGGKARLGKISKMGNRDLRRLLVVGATAALARIKSGKIRTALTESALARWAWTLLARKPFKLVAVALANKLARIAWAVMTKEDCYNAKSLATA